MWSTNKRIDDPESRRVPQARSIFLRGLPRVRSITFEEAVTVTKCIIRRHEAERAFLPDLCGLHPDSPTGSMFSDRGTGSTAEWWRSENGSLASNLADQRPTVRG